MCLFSQPSLATAGPACTLDKYLHCFPPSLRLSVRSCGRQHLLSLHPVPPPPPSSSFLCAVVMESTSLRVASLVWQVAHPLLAYNAAVECVQRADDLLNAGAEMLMRHAEAGEGGGSAAREEDGSEEEEGEEEEQQRQDQEGKGKEQEKEEKEEASSECPPCAVTG